MQEVLADPAEMRRVLLHCSASPSPANEALALALGYDKVALGVYAQRHRVVGDVLQRVRGYGISSYEEAIPLYTGDVVPGDFFGVPSFVYNGASRGNTRGDAPWRVLRECAI